MEYRIGQLEDLDAICLLVKEAIIEMEIHGIYQLDFALTFCAFLIRNKPDVCVDTGVVKEILGTTGPVNNFIVSTGGKPIQFLSIAKYFVPIFTISGIWQSMGWGTILYLAAMSNINPSLYEAAAVDGAGHFQRVWHITIPSIMPTITTLLILDIGGLVGSGGAFEKVFLLYNPMTYSTADIISTYVYRMGLGSGNYSYATAVGLFEGLINLILLTTANFASKKLTDSSLF